jgi:hypothetical protein
MTTLATVQVPESTTSNSSESCDPDSGADRVTPLSPGASPRLAHLSDAELLTRTLCLVGKSNQILATLLEHLAEVEARGLHRQKACASLYTYCIYELRFSEDAAARRSSAAKLARRFPAILSAVARSEIHLTGLLLLGPHLTDENHLKLLSLAKFRTKKEILKLIRRLAPLPVVPDRMEPLGAQPGSQLNPTWSEFVESLCPPVRELGPHGPSGGSEGCVMGMGDPVRTAVAGRGDSPGGHGDESFSRARTDAGRTTDFCTVPARREGESDETSKAPCASDVLDAQLSDGLDSQSQRGNGNAAPARREGAVHSDSDTTRKGPSSPVQREGENVALARESAAKGENDPTRAGDSRSPGLRRGPTRGVNVKARTSRRSKSAPRNAT